MPDKQAHQRRPLTFGLKRSPIAAPFRASVTPPHSDHERWFSEEVHPHRGALRSYVQRSFPGVRDVDDVVQDSLLRIWTARASRQIGCARAFLFKIARHRALDLLRHDRASPLVGVRDLSALSVAEGDPSPADALSTAEKIEWVAEAIAALPDRCREIVVLRKLQGLSQREVATHLGLSERTVEVQVARGVRRCAEYLRRRGLTATDDCL
ncbi:MAG: polymerase, sigma-24 subunit, subfamily [Verrucomicrobia bacterium]|nr:polymerase, sigma-24 subunit, subfamily [Verrucomicrobiota bacterium]